jgi:hypothetical protein
LGTLYFPNGYRLFTIFTSPLPANSIGGNIAYSVEVTARSKYQRAKIKTTSQNSKSEAAGSRTRDQKVNEIG